MKNLFKISFALICIAFIRLILAFSINQIIITNYNKQIYNNSLVKALYVLNFNEPYVAYYNHGNILYKTGDYNEAINKYNTALKRFPSKKRICDIRVNLSLSILATIDNNSKNSLDLLKEAKDNLYKNDCVDKDYKESKNMKAEKLEKQIKEIIKSTNKNKNKDDKKDNDKKDDDNPYSHIEREIIEREKAANKSRQQELNQYQNMNDFEYYPGKRW